MHLASTSSRMALAIKKSLKQRLSDIVSSPQANIDPVEFCINDPVLVRPRTGCFGCSGHICGDDDLPIAKLMPGYYIVVCCELKFRFSMQVSILRLITRTDCALSFTRRNTMLV